MKKLTYTAAAIAVTLTTATIVAQPNIATAANNNVTYVYGDTNNDNDVTLEDAQNILQYALNIQNPTNEQNIRADINNDNDVTLNDAQLALQMALNIIPKTKNIETPVDEPSPKPIDAATPTPEPTVAPTVAPSETQSPAQTPKPTDVVPDGYVFYYTHEIIEIHRISNYDHHADLTVLYYNYLKDGGTDIMRIWMLYNSHPLNPNVSADAWHHEDVVVGTKDIYMHEVTHELIEVNVQYNELYTGCDASGCIITK